MTKKMMKKLARFILTLAVAALTAQSASAENTAGCMLHVNAAQFNHPGLTKLTWQATVSEYDYISSASNPFRLRIEFNSVGFMGSGGICYVGAMIQNVGHAFPDDAYDRNITSFPGLGLYLTSLQPDWPDSGHGVSLNVDPTAGPHFGRIFENIDYLGHSGKNIYTRLNIGNASPLKPITIRWTVTKGDTVVNPPGNFSRDLSGNWVPLVGTFVKWNFTIEINGTAFNVADYYLPINNAEYVLATDPLVLHQEYFGSSEGILNGERGDVCYTDLWAFDGANRYSLEDWNLTWRIDDGAGNLDNRFGWKSDGVSLTSRVGHQSDVHRVLAQRGDRFCPRSILVGVPPRQNYFFSCFGLEPWSQ